MSSQGECSGPVGSIVATLEDLFGNGPVSTPASAPDVTVEDASEEEGPSEEAVRAERAAEVREGPVVGAASVGGAARAREEPVVGAAHVERAQTGSEAGTSGFSNEKVVNLISDNIGCNYKEHAPNWKSASSTLKKDWWNWFEWRVSYDPRDKARVKKAWEDAMKTRLRQMIYRAYHKEEHEKPDWISVDLHRQLKNRPLEDPTFTPRSEQNSANRRSGSDEKGKALATHVMGRKSTLQYMDSMIDKDGKGDIPSALQMLEKTRKHSTKGWLSKKTGQLFETGSICNCFQSNLAAGRTL
ncbi:uncharacterized protein LOC141613666 [Silene latifolia]|uniref:uncharacterized protein LOC141613666 n=1 Tax=Silene latifolia TaxID=37657 RepID=UPI003D76CCCD